VYQAERPRYTVLMASEKSHMRSLSADHNYGLKPRVQIRGKEPCTHIAHRSLHGSQVGLSPTLCLLFGTFIRFLDAERLTGCYLRNSKMVDTRIPQQHLVELAETALLLYRPSIDGPAQSHRLRSKCFAWSCGVQHAFALVSIIRFMAQGAS